MAEGGREARAADAGAGPVAPRRRLSRRAIIVLAAAVGLAACALVVVKAITGGDSGAATVEGPGGVELTLEKPEEWSELEDEREELPGQPLAVLRREDRRGLVILNAQDRPAGTLSRVSRELDRRLAKEIGDFRKVSSRTVQVKAGNALLYSYARKRKGTAHTLLVVPVGERSYTLNVVVPAGAKDAAREASEILLGFDVQD